MTVTTWEHNNWDSVINHLTEIAFLSTTIYPNIKPLAHFHA